MCKITQTVKTSKHSVTYCNSSFCDQKGKIIKLSKIDSFNNLADFRKNYT